ncbi:hypothetical protein UB43_17785 [Pseudomonas sp. 21]|uniref:DUF2845 domain-containing protein n=1 Tax=unclassified Pseudomonas TaxID=196821 RepID=UPI0005EB6C19|nr:MULTISPECIES: DUF2845 domain-containing protein [unclassified Pseudomonas]KJJ98522.1 hypothetical protein UB43_17785 [Pseudomonas sp. 21]MBV7584278.1 DUF2845 domain-containing protein [Pseudomonas sp. PDM33]
MRYLLIPLLALFAASAAHAGTLRCGTSLINEGDPMDEVLAKCGQPAKRVVTPPTKPRRGADGKFIPGRPQLETWMYGPSNGAYRYLFFRDTQLQLINTTRKELL